MNQQVQILLEKYITLFPTEISRHEILRQQLQNDENITSRKNFTGHVTANATILDLTQTKVFLIHHKILDKWFTPGGHFEKEDTSMLDNAKRELKEETGFSNFILHPWHDEHNMIPLDLDTHEIPESPKRNEPAHLHHDFRYVFILENDEQVVLQEEEVIGGKWFEIEKDTGNQSTDIILKKLRTIM